MAMPNPHHLLPVVEVSSLDGVENLATDGAPRCVVVVRAESLDHARAMLSALRAKGLLGDLHGGDLDVSDAGSADSDTADEGSGSDGHGADDVAVDGWDVRPLDRLLRASDLGLVLDEIAADTLPRLLQHPADADLLRHLRILGREIRRIGKEMPGLMGQAPVTFGNYVQNVTSEALKRGGSDRPAWVQERTGRMLVRVYALSNNFPVSFT